MKFVGKSIVDKEELETKLRLGVSDIEIQLFYIDFVKADLNEFFNIVTNMNVNVVAVHLPLKAKPVNDFNLEFFTQPEYNEIFIKACRFSQMLADYYNHDINIIVHNGLSLDKLKYMTILIDKLIEIFDYVIDIFPNIKFSIENVVPIDFNQEKLAISCFDGFLFDNVDIANFFNEKCIRPVFFTTLDTCHMMYSLKVLNLFSKESFYIEHTYNDFFNKNKDTLNNIHLCNLTNYGYGYLEHGSGFTKDNKDIEFLNYFFNKINEINFKGTITLELIEEDYSVCDNLKRTLEILKDFERR